MKKSLLVVLLIISSISLFASEASSITIWNGTDQDLLVCEVECEPAGILAMFPYTLKPNEIFHSLDEATAVSVKTISGSFSKIFRNRINRSAPHICQGMWINLVSENGEITEQELHQKSMPQPSESK